MRGGRSGYRGQRSLDRRRSMERALLAAFQRFLREVRRAEAAAATPVAEARPAPPVAAEAASATSGAATFGAAESSTGSPGAQAAVEAVRAILLPAVENFSREVAGVLPAAGGDRAGEAARAATAFADERLLAFSWPGRAVWLDRPLEWQLFATRNGGEAVYRRIDALTGSGAAEKALALLYLSILNLGFRGRYDPAHERDAASLDAYRARLFRLAAGRAPDIEAAGAALTDTESPPQQGGEPRYLPHVRPWIAALAGVVAVFLAASHLLWLSHTQELADRLARITAEMGF